MKTLPRSRTFIFNHQTLSREKKRVLQVSFAWATKYFGSEAIENFLETYFEVNRVPDFLQWRWYVVVKRKTIMILHYKLTSYE